jgi:hypothetical protein
MSNVIRVGLDAHKKAINVAVVGHETKQEQWVVENKPAAIRRLVKKAVRDADGNEVRWTGSPGKRRSRGALESGGDGLQIACRAARILTIRRGEPGFTAGIWKPSDAMQNGLIVSKKTREG